MILFWIPENFAAGAESCEFRCIFMFPCSEPATKLHSSLLTCYHIYRTSGDAMSNPTRWEGRKEKKPEITWLTNLDCIILWCWVLSSCRDDSQSATHEEEGQGEALHFKIKAHLEDLFSDSHLAEDGFLLKHVQKNKQGYVSLKLLTCLKKVKHIFLFFLLSAVQFEYNAVKCKQKLRFWHCLLQIKALTTDWHVTLAAAESSGVLQVNDERTKVRRAEPLPQWLLCSPSSKLLLIWSTCEEPATGGDAATRGLEQRIVQLRACTGVTAVWILQPGQTLPKELQCYTKRHKELGHQLCAVLKFDSLEAVRKIYSTLKVEEESRKGICVVPLGFQSMYHISRDKSSEDSTEDRPVDTLSQKNPSEDPVQQEEEVEVEEEVSPEKTQGLKPLNNSTQSSFGQISSSSSSSRGQAFSGLSVRCSRKNGGSGDGHKESFQIPWVLRRKIAAGALNPKAPGLPNTAPGLMLRVLRQPLGPDGTRGFQARVKLQQQIKDTERRMERTHLSWITISDEKKRQFKSWWRRNERLIELNNKSYWSFLASLCWWWEIVWFLVDVQSWSAGRRGQHLAVLF